MDKKKGILNVTVSVSFKILLLIGSLLVRRFLINYVADGDRVNGLDSLYTSIIGFLSVAELGIGSAITFCMYKPVVEGDNKKLSALYFLFKKLNLVIGGVILAGGVILMPFLKYLAADYSSLNVNLYFTFGLMLVSVVLTYMFSAKTAIINAYKNNYITTAISSGGQLLQYVLQIITVVITRSFVGYLVCRIVAVAAQWIITELITRFKYGAVIADKQIVDAETRHNVSKNVKAMFMHKIGAVLVNSVDSIIISAFIGVAVLGYYSNYVAVMTAMTGLLALFFTPLTSVVGHMCLSEDNESVLRYYKFFHVFNFIIGVVFFLGYYAVIDDFIAIWLGADHIMAKSISFVITLNSFIQFMRKANTLFRDATGTFYYDRWRAVVEGVVNIVLSVAFVLLFKELFGPEIGVVGVIAATIVTNIFICHVVDPYVLYKHVFLTSPKKFYFKNYLFIAIFAVALIAVHFSLQSFESRWIELLVNGCIAVAVSVVPCAAVLVTDKNFRSHFKSTVNRFKVKFAGRKSASPQTAVGEEVSEGENARGQDGEGDN